MKLKLLIKDLPKKCVQFLILIGVSFGILFYPFVLFGGYLYLKLAILLSKTSPQKFKGPIRGISTFLSPDKIFKQPNATLVHLTILKGTPDRQLIFQHLQNIYDIPKTHGANERKYERLAYSLEPWMGYLFWKEIENFQIRKQVHFIHDENFTDGDPLSTFVEGIIRKPFVRNEPLWELFVISTGQRASESEESGQSGPCYIVQRSHHILLDGMSLIKLWNDKDSLNASNSNEVPTIPMETSSNLLKCSKVVEERSQKTERGWLRCKLKLARNVLLKSPFLSRTHLFTTKDNHCIMEDYKELNGLWWCSGLNRIYIEEYRQPLRDLGFSLTHALLVGYSRGFKRFIQENFGKQAVPKKIHILGSVPRPNYPQDEALTNHWAIMRYKVDYSKETLMEELNFAKNEYLRAVQDIIPEAFESSYRFGVPHLPRRFMEFLWDTVQTGSLSLSNIPGPTVQQTMFGQIVTDRVIWLPLTRNNSGIGALMLTYNGWSTISLTADSGCIKTKKSFQQLNDFIIEEMQRVLDHCRNIAQSNNSTNLKDPHPDANDLEEVTVLK